MQKEPTAIVQAVQALVLAVMVYAGYAVTAETTTLIGAMCALGVPALISLLSALAIRANVYSQESVWTVEEQHVERGKMLSENKVRREVRSEIERAVVQNMGTLETELGRSVVERMNKEREKEEEARDKGVEEATGLRN